MCVYAFSDILTEYTIAPRTGPCLANVPVVSISSSVSLL